MSGVPLIELNSKHMMPSIGYGTYLISGTAPLKTAIKRGYRLIDTAYLYENEKIVGEAVQEVISEGKLKREDFFIVTKLSNIANRPEDVDKYLKASLKNLNTDYIDLYLMHHPFGVKGSHMEDFFPLDANGLTQLRPKTDLEGIWKVLEQKVDEGLVKAIGVSNFNSVQIGRIMKNARIPPAVNQVEAHIYLQQTQLNEICKQHSIHLMAFSPIGAPFKNGGSEGVKRILDDPTLNKISREKNRTPAQVAMRFLIQLGYSVIPKSENHERIKENFQLFDFQLSEDEMGELVKLDMGPKGRIFTYKVLWPGSDAHEDYPFKIDF